MQADQPIHTMPTQVHHCRCALPYCALQGRFHVRAATRAARMCASLLAPAGAWLVISAKEPAKLLPIVCSDNDGNAFPRKLDAVKIEQLGNVYMYVFKLAPP